MKRLGHHPIITAFVTAIISIMVVAGVVWAAIPNGPNAAVGLYWYDNTDPTAGGGMAAPLAQLLVRTDAPSLYYKSGATNTAWTKIGSGTSSGGTVTSVACASGITCTPSSPITGSGTVELLQSCAPNQVLAWTGATWACSTPTTGTVTGTGVANTVTKWAGPSSIENSGITDDGTIVTTTENASIGNVNAQILVNGPTVQSLTIPSVYAFGEINQIALSGIGHTGAGDIFASVIRNGVTFDTTAGANRSGGGAFEVTSTKSAGGNILTDVGFESSAVGGDVNIAYEALDGDVQVDTGNFLVNSGYGFFTGPFLAASGTIFAESNGTYGLAITGTPTYNIEMTQNASSINVNNGSPSTLTLQNSGVSGVGGFLTHVAGSESVGGSFIASGGSATASGAAAQIVAESGAQHVVDFTNSANTLTDTIYFSSTTLTFRDTTNGFDFFGLNPGTGYLQDPQGIEVFAGAPLIVAGSGQLIFNGTGVALACNGTGGTACASSTCNNNAGTLTTNTGATTCTVTFVGSPPNAPSCTVGVQSATIGAYVSAEIAASLTITFLASATGLNVDYVCGFH